MKYWKKCWKFTTPDTSKRSQIRSTSEASRVAKGTTAVPSTTAAALLLFAANNCDLVCSPQKSNMSIYTGKWDGKQVTNE